MTSDERLFRIEDKVDKLHALLAAHIGGHEAVAATQPPKAPLVAWLALVVSTVAPFVLHFWR